MQLFAYDFNTDSYQLKKVYVNSLSDMDTLKGDATELYSQTSILLDYQTNSLEWKKKGRPVAFQAFKSNGVWIPVDYDSLAMASIYYNIELAHGFFVEQLGLSENTIGVLPTYYWADLVIIEKDGRKSEMYDNAFYMYINDQEQAFFIVPFEQLEWVPMALNSGIVAHEYAHAVFDKLVLNQNLQTAMTDPGKNFLYALNEGCSDYMAVALTRDPDFIAHSIPKGTYGIQCNSDITIEIVRDASQVLTYTKDMDKAARGSKPADFCPYQIGEFWSSLLYAIALDLDGVENRKIPSAESLAKVAHWLLLAQEDLGQNLNSDFELYDIISILVSKINVSSERDIACSVIQQRYALYFSGVKGC